MNENGTNEKREVYWKRFVQELGNVTVMRLMESSVASDMDKNTACASLALMLDEDAARLQGVKLQLVEAEVIAIAMVQLKVASWYARWWYLDMAESGWMTTGGIQVNVHNWRKLMLAWWRNAYDETKDAIREEYGIRTAALQAKLAQEM